MSLLRRLFPTDRAQRAWCLYDWANSAFATSVLAVFLPVYFAKVVVPPDGVTLPILGLAWHTGASSLWAYTVSLSVLLVAVSAPLVGRVADEKASRKGFLLLCVAAGASATAFLAACGPGDVFRTLATFMAAYVAFSTSEIFYNSYLPHIAVASARDWLSGLGYAYGYVGGGLLLAVHLWALAHPTLLGLEDSAAAIRVFFLSVGIWWAVFSVPCALWLPKGIRRVREDDSHPPHLFSREFWAVYREIAAFPGALLMVCAYFFFNNGIQTVIAMASMYGATALKLETGDIALAFLITQAVAFPGALLLSRLAESHGTKRVLLVSIGLWCLIVLAAYKVDTAAQFQGLAACVGFVLGGSQALSRSLFSRLIPRERSSQFFGFFAVGGKFSALLGPFFFGLVQDLTEEPRSAILSVLFFFLAGLVLMWRVPEDD
ncbi:MFS transporter, UMF1 family [Desulfacinum infernum DSM 9756]|uniref:MFS transporter, UMF1 family n=1 Tax=Desulfacinum infernum DSM 9756 TaxID=1121391 RepID=A0A1M4TWV2_9BACT|nr:MFS transporter [Desulfacinum infernum]SHE48854.1 MFS transporter, UMF1 family [Desulfacinum infernum DSM 9756]